MTTTELRPLPDTSTRMVQAILLSFLCPGAGHLRAGRPLQGLFWCLLVQGMFFTGLHLVGNAQLDWGTAVAPGGRPLLFLLIPELGNFPGTWFAGLFLQSAEAGGRYPEFFPHRDLGYALSGAAGILAAFAAAHAAGAVLAARERPAGPVPQVHPGSAALLTLLLPGLGHWRTGRRFKALWFGGLILGLFVLGLALGDFADLERQRHPYYWTGQMFLGPVAWILTVLLADLRFTRVLPYQDAGLLFTTAAGLFTVIAALDAWHRAEQDWLRAARRPDPEAGAWEPGPDEPDSAAPAAPPGEEAP